LTIEIIFIWTHQLKKENGINSETRNGQFMRWWACEKWILETGRRM